MHTNELVKAKFVSTTSHELLMFDLKKEAIKIMLSKDEAFRSSRSMCGKIKNMMQNIKKENHRYFLKYLHKFHILNRKYLYLYSIFSDYFIKKVICMTKTLR